MNGIQAQAIEGTRETYFKAVAGGSLLEAFGAIATVALAIVGLAGTWPTLMAAIATIVVGAATLMEAGAFGMKNASETFHTEGFMGVDALAGVAAVVLGILALLGVSPVPLVSVAVLTLGTGFLLSGRLFGIGAAILGILAVCGLASASLYLVGILVLGAALLLSGHQFTERTVPANAS